MQVEFQELLSNNCSRKAASRAFSHVLGKSLTYMHMYVHIIFLQFLGVIQVFLSSELVTAQILAVRQDQSYGTITLLRGEQF